MTFEEIFRDIWSRLELITKDIKDLNITYLDILKAFNDSLLLVKKEYIENNKGYNFAVTETFTNTISDTVYPFLNTCTLQQNVYKSADPSKVILNMIVIHNEDYQEYLIDIGDGSYLYFDLDYYLSLGNTGTIFLNGTPGSYLKGTTTVINNKLYICVEDIVNEITDNLIFNSKDVRKITENNNLKYFQNQVVFNGNSYYRVISDFQNIDSSTFELNTIKVYWKFIGDAYLKVYVYPFERIQTIDFLKNLDREYGVTFKDNKLYFSSNITNLIITYVPETILINNITDQITFPELMIPILKERTLNILKEKLNLPLEKDRK